jgi:hypothetical protein
VEVNFVGSMACLLQNELKVICESEGINMGTIIRKPLKALVDYHLSLVN